MCLLSVHGYLFTTEIIFQYHFTNLSNNEYILNNEAKINQTKKPNGVKVFESRYIAILETSGSTREPAK